MHPTARALSTYVTVGGVSLLTLAALNMAADKFPATGLSQLRDYLIRRNG